MAALGVLVIIFILLRLLPGDPVEIFLFGAGRGGTSVGLVTAERIEQARAAYNLDKPIPVQFALYVWAVARGDLGRSFRTNQPVGDIIKEQFPPTVQLTLAGMGFGLLLGTVAGVVSAIRHQTIIDYLAQLFAVLGAAIPTFLLGLVLIYVFSIRLGWLPAVSGGHVSGIVLPAVSLGVYSSAIVSRLTRSSMLEVLTADYIRTARSKGLTERAVIWRHALRNALIPVVTIVGLQFGALLAGAVIVEVVFTRQGLGFTLVKAITMRDYPVVQGLIMLAALVYILMNLIVDFLYTYINPRIRLG